jgi:hypothetical protein
VHFLARKFGKFVGGEGKFAERKLSTVKCQIINCAGMYLDVQEMYYVYNIPVFLETKYSPMKGGMSPFVSLRTGFSVTDYLATGFYLSPAVGVDLRRFSLFVRYGFNLFPMSADISIPDLDMDINTKVHLKTHSLSLGAAINF